MKTFLTRPLKSGRPLPEGLPEKLLGLKKRCLESSDLVRHLHEIFISVIEFDYIFVMLPVRNDRRCYFMWPPHNGIDTMSWPKSAEEDDVLFHSIHKTIVRICESTDYSSTTVSVIKKYFKEANTDKFSLLFMRHTFDDFFALIGFISFSKDAYDDEDADILFDINTLLIDILNNCCPGASEHGLFSNNFDYLNLTLLPGMRKALDLVRKVGREDIPVLILGETGTGKEGVANHIYNASGRNMRPFIKVNCGGIAPSLLESTLFGYQKNAFTGALHDTAGCFEEADTGVLLLDEMGELPTTAQTHLLRVLQEKCVVRVGSHVPIPVNVRIIAATNKNLARMAKDGSFRSDLFYRLSLFPIYIPSLRERPEDIPILLDFFIAQSSQKMGIMDPPVLAPSELKHLVAYKWPGNIREMQNSVIRAMLMWNGNRRIPFSIPVGDDIFGDMFPSMAGQPIQGTQETPQPRTSLRLQDVEREHILYVLGKTEGRIGGKGGAADLLDINPSTLRARMQKLGIDPRAGRPNT